MKLCQVVHIKIETQTYENLMITKDQLQATVCTEIQ